MTDSRGAHSCHSRRGARMLGCGVRERWMWYVVMSVCCYFLFIREEAEFSCEGFRLPNGAAPMSSHFLPQQGQKKWSRARTSRKLRSLSSSRASTSPSRSTSLRGENSCLQAVENPGLPLKYGPGHVALVTGAGRGIGRAVAETLARVGTSHVVCVDLTKEGCEEVVETIQAMGGEASAYGADVSDPRAVSNLCQVLLSEHGHIDILVNNAGITKDGLFMRMRERDWLDVINVNLNSVFYFASPLLRQMVKNRFGRIINMASVVGVGGNAGQANYAASKAGLIGFTRALAKETASRNVTVNAIAPGFIRTQMAAAMTVEAKEAVLASIPAGRMGTVQEVADLAAFLSSHNAGYLTGKVIPLDGGMLFGSN